MKGRKNMRRIRSDCRVGTLEKKLGLPAGTIRNKNGRDTRSDKKNRNYSQRSKVGGITMEKKIRKRYHSEEAVKKALKIDSFRNLTKDKVMEFTSMIPYMEKEVAIEIIKQFPVYVEFAESAIEKYTQLCKTILETNKEEYEQAVHAHQYVLETFAKQLEQENLTSEERRAFSEKMIEEAEKITELYLQQQKFHERVLKTIGGVVTLALGVTVTVLGLKAIGSDEDLPQLDDHHQNVA